MATKGLQHKCTREITRSHIHILRPQAEQKFAQHTGRCTRTQSNVTARRGMTTNSLLARAHKHICSAPAIMTASVHFWKGHECATRGHFEGAHDNGLLITRNRACLRSLRHRNRNRDSGRLLAPAAHVYCCTRRNIRKPLKRKLRPRTPVFCNIHVCAQSYGVTPARILQHHCFCRHTHAINGDKVSATQMCA